MTNRNGMFGPWEPVPKYALRRLIGHDVRRRVPRVVNGLSIWQYANSKKVASDILAQQFDPDQRRGGGYAEAQQAPTQLQETVSVKKWKDPR